MSKPFLKWVGGKAGMAESLMALLPHDICDRDVFEPMLGGGAMLLAMRGAGIDSPARVNDINQHLAGCWTAVRDSPGELFESVSAMENTPQVYYEVRERQRSGDGLTAAEFLYLNHTSFGGLWRVNVKGQMNAPFGNRPNFPPRGLKGRINAASKAIAGVEITSASIFDLPARAGEFVYIDSPYINTWSKYSKGGWGLRDVCKLRLYVDDASDVGAKVMVSQPDCAVVRELFADMHIEEIVSTQTISRAKGVKPVKRELVIRNYRS